MIFSKLIPSIITSRQYGNNRKQNNNGGKARTIKTWQTQQRTIGSSALRPSVFRKRCLGGGVRIAPHSDDFYSPKHQTIKLNEKVAQNRSSGSKTLFSDRLNAQLNNNMVVTA